VYSRASFHPLDQFIEKEEETQSKAPVENNSNQITGDEEHFIDSTLDTTTKFIHVGFGSTDQITIVR
jgi:hypothetical protein